MEELGGVEGAGGGGDGEVSALQGEWTEGKGRKGAGKL